MTNPVPSAAAKSFVDTVADLQKASEVKNAFLRKPVDIAEGFAGRLAFYQDLNEGTASLDDLAERAGELSQPAFGEITVPQLMQLRENLSDYQIAFTPAEVPASAVILTEAYARVSQNFFPSIARRRFLLATDMRYRPHASVMQGEERGQYLVLMGRYVLLDTAGIAIILAALVLSAADQDPGADLPWSAPGFPQALTEAADGDSDIQQQIAYALCGAAEGERYRLAFRYDSPERIAELRAVQEEITAGALDFLVGHELTHVTRGHADTRKPAASGPPWFAPAFDDWQPAGIPGQYLADFWPAHSRETEADFHALWCAAGHRASELRLMGAQLAITVISFLDRASYLLQHGCDPADVTGARNYATPGFLDIALPMPDHPWGQTRASGLIAAFADAYKDILSESELRRKADLMLCVRKIIDDAGEHALGALRWINRQPGELIGTVAGGTLWTVNWLTEAEEPQQLFSVAPAYYADLDREPPVREWVTAAHQAAGVHRRLAGVATPGQAADLRSALNSLCTKLAGAGHRDEADQIWESAAVPDDAAGLAMMTEQAAFLLSRSETTSGIRLLVQVLAAPEVPADVTLIARMLLREQRRQHPGEVSAAWRSAHARPPPDWLYLTPEQLGAVTSWIGTGTWAESRQYFTEHLSQLSSDATFSVLDELALAAPGDVISAHRTLLDAILRDGLTAAYQPLLAQAAPTLSQTVRQWVATPTWEASQAYLEDHPELLGAGFAATLAELPEDNPDTTVAIHRALLALAGTPAGVDGAYRCLHDPGALRAATAAALTARDTGRLRACAVLEAFVHQEPLAGMTHMILALMLGGEAGLLPGNWAAQFLALADRTGPVETRATLTRFAAELSAARAGAEVTAELTHLLVQAETRLHQRLLKLVQARMTAGTGQDPAALDQEAVAELCALYETDPDAVPAGARAYLSPAAGESAIPGVPGGAGLSADRARQLSNLSVERLRVYERTGSLPDLDAAIDAARQAADAMPAGHRDQAAVLSNLSNALRTRYTRGGDLDDLDDAVTASQLAAETIPAGHTDQAGIATNLGLALRRRFERTGQRGDLDAAVTAAQRAADGTPAGHHQRGAVLSNLSNILLNRYDLTGQPEDLDAAVGAGEQSVAEAPPDHPDLGRYLSNSGNALRKRFAQTGDRADLDAAIAAAERAVAVTPHGHPGRPERLANLGSGLQVRFLRTLDPADLDAAIAAAQEALEIMPPGHVERPGLLSNLAIALRRRNALTSGGADPGTAQQQGTAAPDSEPGSDTP
jgi:hypothetical protein